MVDAYDPSEKEKENLGPDGLPITITNPGVVGTSSTQSGSESTPTENKGTSSGRFSNITNYLNANKNFNQDAGGLAGKIAGNITEGQKNLTDKISNAVTNFNTQGQGQVAATSTAKDLTSQAVVDPNAFVQNQGNVDAVIQARNATYTGPKTLGDVKEGDNQYTLQAKAKDFTDTVNQGQTESGRYNLLRTMFNRQGYNKGQQNLDNLLIQGDKNQLDKIQNTRASSNVVNQDLNKAIQTAQQTGVQNTQTVADNALSIRDMLNQRATQENAGIKKSTQEAVVTHDKTYDNFLTNLKNGRIAKSEAARFGLNKGEVYGNVNLMSLLQKGLGPTEQSVANQGNYSTISALQKLLGNTDATADNQKLFESFTNPEAVKQASTFDPENFNFDTQGLRDQVVRQQAAYTAERAPWANHIAQAQQGIIDSQAKYDKAIDDSKNPSRISDWYFNKAHAELALNGNRDKLSQAQQQIAALKSKYNFGKILQFIED